MIQPIFADLAEQPLTPDTPVPTACRDYPLNTLPTYQPTFPHIAPQRIPRTVRFGILSVHTSPPCGVTKFAAGLAAALSAHGSEVGTIWVADGFSSTQLDMVDVAIIQHDQDVAGDEVVDIVEGLLVPSILVVHTVPKDPTSHQRSALEAIAATADHVVVMSEAARQRLYLTYAVDRRKVTTIPHGATLPNIPRVKRPSRPIILTWGLLHQGKGIERVIDAMPSLNDVPGRPRYLVAGPTHPNVSATDGQAYRDACMEQARRIGVADSVTFDPGYYDESMLTDLIQQSSVVVLPYESTEQVTSGVLVEAVANGRPVVATAFPHATELLGTGAGFVVEHDDPVALASALRQIITQPRLSGSMAAEARRLAPDMAWPVVAAAYDGLAQRLLAEGRARA